MATTSGPHPGWAFGACVGFVSNKFRRDQGTSRVLAIEDRGVGQRVPGTAWTEVVLMFSEHFNTVGKEGSLAELARAFKSPSLEVAGVAGSPTAQQGFRTWRQDGEPDLFVLVQTYRAARFPAEFCAVSSLHVFCTKMREML